MCSFLSLPSWIRIVESSLRETYRICGRSYSRYERDETNRCRSSSSKWLNFRDSVTLFAADRSKPLSFVRSTRFRFQRARSSQIDFSSAMINHAIDLFAGSRYFLRRSVDNLAQLRAILGLGSQRNMCVTSDWISARVKSSHSARSSRENDNSWRNGTMLLNRNAF